MCWHGKHKTCLIFYILVLRLGVNSSTLDKLIRDVFTDNSTEYVHVARPRCDENEAVIVTIDVALRQIVELVK